MPKYSILCNRTITEPVLNHLSHSDQLSSYLIIQMFNRLTVRSELLNKSFYQFTFLFSFSLFTDLRLLASSSFLFHSRDIAFSIHGAHLELGKQHHVSYELIIWTDLVPEKSIELFFRLGCMRKLVISIHTLDGFPLIPLRSPILRNYDSRILIFFLF